MNWLREQELERGRERGGKARGNDDRKAGQSVYTKERRVTCSVRLSGLSDGESCRDEEAGKINVLGWKGRKRSKSLVEKGKEDGWIGGWLVVVLMTAKQKWKRQCFTYKG